MTFEVGLPPRYRAVRPLGQGGFGDVMLVRDVDRAEDIAMKRLARMDPASIRRFKNEFRVLQGLRHPALARLHELFAVDDAWFLAMEYIAGVDFSSHVRPGGDSRNAMTLPETPISSAAISIGLAYDETKLRAALARLADGVFTLHRAGIIHRDLKPPNVLVDSHGRVVILDFGLAAHLEGEEFHSADTRLVGTPGYMAPEQAQSQPLTRAVDWYAVGVMLFEALTGRRPFIGSLKDIVDAQMAGAPDPAQYGSTLPADLHYLCMRLLAPRAEDRPEGQEIIGLLGKPEPIVVSAQGSGFVGRTPELKTIASSVDALHRSGPAAFDVIADSGIGKSALVRRAIEHARDTRGAAILSARCYEREAMPYKGVDPLMDELADMLRRRSNEDVLAVMPRDARALCRLFPVLASVEEFARAPEVEAVENRDTLRSRAIAALRELLARIADRQPLIVVLDDMQWCCSDSARVLVDLLSGSGPPRALFMFAYRPQARQTNPALRILADGLAAAHIPRRELVLAPLTESEAMDLARAHAPEKTDETTLRAVVADAQGSPMLIEELLRGDSVTHGLGLDQMLASRIAALAPTARTALEYIAAAGRLIEMRTLRAASGLEAADLAEVIRDLEEAELAQRSPSGIDDIAVETRHDRVREVAYSAIARDKVAAYHRALGEALADRDADPEAIAEHFRLAGDRERALPFIVRAATQAVEALAHDRALALYRLALELAGDADRFALEVALGATLTFDGQGAAAADVFRSALAHAPTPTDAVDLKRRIAEQLLRSGRIDDGLDALDDVLHAAGLAIPRSGTSLLYQRFRLWTRGLEIPKERRPLSRETQVALDACWSASVALAGFDLVRSADLQVRHLRSALDAGDLNRISLGMSMEGVILALDSAKTQQRAALVIEKAEQLAQDVGDPYAMGWASGAASVLAYAEGKWRAAVTLGDYAVALFQVRCVDAAWEVGTVQSWFRLRAQLALGELEAAQADASAVERDAVRRRDLYTQTNLMIGVMPVLRLGANDPAGARSIVADAIGAWSKRGWHNQHLDALRADCVIDLYEGDATRMLARLDEHARHLRGGRQAGRIALHAAKAAALLMQARADASKQAAAFALAKQLARKITAEGNVWASAVAAGIAARVALLDGTDLSPVEAAERAFTGVDMPLHAAALRRLRGDVEAADAILRSHGVVDPARMVEILIC